jgi:hypothetical protein
MPQDDYTLALSLVKANIYLEKNLTKIRNEYYKHYNLEV